ncbi:unnamed protein product [Peronospora farinosa]|uniref:Reverse transcriptase Ty1/copia-type domain-containing protein n=1 Tax=Peronospora farinosa TaxID=134698 RepID=A0AAV0T5Y8_9STRA|nr:unnamed protein product [Peronospora farinosa]
MDGLVIGKSDEVKGYRILFTKDRVVRTSQHVQNIQILSKKANSRLIRHASEKDELIEKSAGPNNRIAESGNKSSHIQYNPIKTGNFLAESMHDVDIGEEPGIDSRKPKSRGKRGVQGKRTNDKATAETPRMTTRYGGKKTSPIGEFYRVDPANWNSLMRSDRRVEWECAAHAESDSLEANDTWELVSCTKEMHQLHTKWAFKTKTDVNRIIKRFKARMVACGNEQLFGKDHTLTFDAVTDMTTGKIILALSQVCGVLARHGDVPNAYYKASTEPGLHIYQYVP